LAEKARLASAKAEKRMQLAQQAMHQANKRTSASLEREAILQLQLREAMGRLSTLEGKAAVPLGLVIDLQTSQPEQAGHHRRAPALTGNSATRNRQLLARNNEARRSQTVTVARGQAEQKGLPYTQAEFVGHSHHSDGTLDLYRQMQAGQAALDTAAGNRDARLTTVLLPCSPSETEVRTPPDTEVE
jgi:hypothetical protein